MSRTYLKDKYRDKYNKDVYADYKESYTDHYVHWLERELSKLQKEVNIKHLKRR